MARRQTGIDPNELCSVMCIKPGLIGLSAPSYRYNVVFREVGQIIRVKFEILQDAVHLDNGYILNNSLIIMDEEVRLELGLNNDIEYDLSLNQVKKIIRNGSLRELEDLLTYGPEGYSRIAAEMAVQEKFDSQAKLELIHKMSGVNVAFQIKEGIGLKTEIGEDGKKDSGRERTYAALDEDKIEVIEPVVEDEEEDDD